MLNKATSVNTLKGDLRRLGGDGVCLGASGEEWASRDNSWSKG